MTTAVTKPHVVHLIDDTTAGGVMRVLDYLTTSVDLAKDANHSVFRVRRGAVSLRSFKADMVVSHLSISWRALPALIALRAANPKTPLVHVEHSYTEAFVALNVRRRGRFQRLLKTAFALFNSVVAVSEAQGAWLQSSGFLPADKVVVIPSCVDLSAFKTLPAHTGPVKVLGAIGRLDAQKGFDVLINAFRQCSDAELRLHIYGVGEDEVRLRELANGDSRIIFKGFACDPVTAYAAVDAVIMPSRWEAYGLVAIEALCAGRILLCSDTDGLRDHIGGGAISVPDNTEEAWARQLRLMTQPTVQRHLNMTYGDKLCDAFKANWRALLRSRC